MIKFSKRHKHKSSKTTLNNITSRQLTNLNLYFGLKKVEEINFLPIVLKFPFSLEVKNTWS